MVGEGGLTVGQTATRHKEEKKLWLLSDSGKDLFFSRSGIERWVINGKTNNSFMVDGVQLSCFENHVLQCLFFVSIFVHFCILNNCVGYFS